jgi:hypothetical protein
VSERTLADLRSWLAGDGPSDEPAPTPPAGDDTGRTREVEFSAYTEDCRIFAFVQLASERLSDALNADDEFRLQSVLLIALEDNRAVELRELVVARDELVVVRASGPRGNAARRIRTRPSPVAVKVGGYLVRGYVHVPPGADPLRRLRTNRPLVPMTEAWIEYTAAGVEHRARVGPVIVNTTFLDWAERATDTDVRKELPVEVRIDPRAKDMTGHVLVRGEAAGDGPRSG